MLADTNEGFPDRDTIRKAAEGLLSVREKTIHSQHFAEVRVGDALLVARAMRIEPLMPLPLTATVWAQYVAPGHARQKLPALSRYLGQVISIAEYWRNLDRAHFFLSALSATSPRRSAQTNPVPPGGARAPRRAHSLGSIPGLEHLALKAPSEMPRSIALCRIPSGGIFRGNREKSNCEMAVVSATYMSTSIPPLATIKTMS
jgi:hypothetical protein